jgi:hypothetical protein
MVLVIGIATSIIDEYYRAMGPDIKLKELTVVMIVAFIMAMLIKSIPPLISGIITGASIGQGSTMGFGSGEIVGVSAMGASAISMGGAAIAAGTASAAGGAQALMAAYSKAAAASSGGMDDMMGGGARAAAHLGGSSSGGGSVFASMDSASSSGSGFSNSGRRSGGGFGSGASESASSGEKVNASASQGKESGGQEASDGQSKSGAGGKAAGSDAKGGGQGNSLAPGEQRSSGSMLGRAAAIAAGTAGNLAQGSWDVAKAKGASMRESAFDRIGETTGGKIAAAIRAQEAAAFSENQLSAGKDQAEPPDASEVADFVNRGSQTS